MTGRRKKQKKRDITINRRKEIITVEWEIDFLLADKKKRSHFQKWLRFFGIELESASAVVAAAAAAQQQNQPDDVVASASAVIAESGSAVTAAAA